jgi:hypothetical protein
VDPRAVFLPVSALVASTFLVLALIPYRRFRAAFRGLVKPADFDHGESPNVPHEVSLPNRNLMNLLEVPILFYLGSILLFLLDEVDKTFLAMSWSYVALRVVHSTIHLTYNNTQHRLVPYGLSNLILSALWIRFTFKLVEHLY